jgi:hypothetical protein
VDVGGSRSEASPGQKHETLSKKKLKQKDWEGVVVGQNDRLKAHTILTL